METDNRSESEACLGHQMALSVQIKVCPFSHTCPTKLRSDKFKPAKSRWVADVILDWARKNPDIGPTALQEKIEEKYHFTVSYMRVSRGTDDDSILCRRPLYDTRHGCVAANRGLSRRATIKEEVSRPGSMP
ncbi:hypothetical protein VPH35_104804 [Triticum aestivum]|uniref:Uncharacterized protein n=1 Tax=Triticum turgidum subsp. durum TaxID=4567 RepID=A0A9R0Y1E8_TRITD|nr:unnamed protein product [Triticum turgidum subsp. durum]